MAHRCTDCRFKMQLLSVTLAVSLLSVALAGDVELLGFSAPVLAWSNGAVINRGKHVSYQVCSSAAATSRRAPGTDSATPPRCIHTFICLFRSFRTWSKWRRTLYLARLARLRPAILECKGSLQKAAPMRPVRSWSLLGARYANAAAATLATAILVTLSYPPCPRPTSWTPRTCAAGPTLFAVLTT